MESLWQDLRYGFRMLARNPGFTAVAVLTLALGIGANTAIFSVVNAVLLRPLPFRDPERMVRMRDILQRPGQEPKIYNTATRNFSVLKEQTEIFEGVTAQAFQWFNLTGAGEPAQIRGIAVSPGWAVFLGVPPVQGRSFALEEERAGFNSRSVLVGHGLWQRRFGGDPGLVGKVLTLNDQSYTVVGILPRLFNYPYAAELWVPGTFDPNGPNQSPNVTARLKQGVTLAQAQARLDDLAQRLQQEDSSYRGWSFRAVPLREDIIGDHHRIVVALLAAVGFLLLIACVNVANLLLARAAVRRKEIAIRAALGATRVRQARQLLTESMLLALLGGAAGLLLAAILSDFLVALSPPVTSLSLFFQDIRVDGQVLGFSLLVTLFTGVLFGLAPVLKLSTSNLYSTLKEGERTSGSSGGHRLLHALVVSEIALTLVLLIGAGMMASNFAELLRRDFGFPKEKLLTARLTLPGSEYRGVAARRTFIEKILERVENLPGVRSAGFSTMLPIEMATERTESSQFIIEGHPPDPEGQSPVANLRGVTPAYFKAMGIPLLRGRVFAEDDGRSRDTLNVIISNRMARHNWPEEDPLGERIRLGGPNAQGPWWMIVGVVSDVRDTGDVGETLYLPIPFTGDITLVVRSAVDAASLSRSVRSAIWEADPKLPLERVFTMKRIVDDSLSQERLSTFLLSLFAAFGLGLAALGIYGVISYAVTERTHEIGIRMALGAQRKDIFRLVVGQGMKLTLIGVAVGLAGSFALTRFLSSMLFGVSATDPMIFAGVALLLAAVALLACYIPARRATRVDPLVALRYE